MKTVTTNRSKAIRSTVVATVRCGFFSFRGAPTAFGASDAMAFPSRTTRPLRCGLIYLLEIERRHLRWNSNLVLCPRHRNGRRCDAQSKEFTHAARVLASTFFVCLAGRPKQVNSQPELTAS